MFLRRLTCFLLNIVKDSASSYLCNLIFPFTCLLKYVDRIIRVTVTSCITLFFHAIFFKPLVFIFCFCTLLCGFVGFCHVYRLLIWYLYYNFLVWWYIIVYDYWSHPPLVLSLFCSCTLLLIRECLCFLALFNLTPLYIFVLLVLKCLRCLLFVTFLFVFMKLFW